MVTAVIDASGKLVEVKFNTTRYRQMAPAELGNAVREVVEAARVQMAARVRSAYAPLARGATGDAPGLRDVVSGRVNAASYLDSLMEQFDQARRAGD